MKLFVLLVALFASGCCHKQKPRIISVIGSCLGHPNLPKRPVLARGVQTTREECPESLACFTIDSAADLDAYLSAVKYYHRQLDTVCGGGPNE